MSGKSMLWIGLLVVVCVAVIVGSAFVMGRLAGRFAPFQDHGPFPGPSFERGSLGPLDRFGPFLRNPTGRRGIVSAVGGYAFLFLTGVLALFAFPRPLRRLEDAFRRGGGETVRLFGLGMLTGLAVLLLTALGFFTLAAFPLPILLVVALFFAVWAGMTGLSLAFGRGINRRVGLAQSSPVLDMAIGTLVLFTLSRIPLLGIVILLLLASAALGAAVSTRFGTGGAWTLAALADAPGRIERETLDA